MPTLSSDRAAVDSDATIRGAEVGAEETTAPHRRQFVVGPAPFAAMPQWRHVRLEDRWLSHCPTLPVAVVRDTDARPWALLGRAVESRAGREDPVQRMASAGMRDLPALYSGWAGRWVLLCGGELHLDASGLLGCYVGRAPDGNVWASSSPPLAAMLASGGTPPPPEPWLLRYEAGVSWVVPPRSRFRGVQRLLPSQVLVLADGSVRWRPLVEEPEPQRPEGQTLDLLESALATALRGLSGLGRLWLGLTAGADSRLVLAAARRAGVRVSCFTRRAPRASLADTVLPPHLAATAGMEHRFIEGIPRPGAERLSALHTARHVGKGDAEPFVRGDRRMLDGLAVGGLGGEVGRSYRPLPRRASRPVADADAIAHLLGVPHSAPAYGALVEWLEWVVQTPQVGLDLRDRFAIEQRQAGWLAAKEQLYDLDRVERVVLLNSHHTTGLVLSLPERARVERSWQHELVRRSVPGLAAYPYNPSDRHFGVARAAAWQLRHPVVSFRRAGRRARRALDAVSASRR